MAGVKIFLDQLVDLLDVVGATLFKNA